MLEMQLELGKGGLQGGLVYPAVRNESLLHCEESDPAVHGAGIEIKEREFFGYKLGESAFAGGGIAVHSDYYVGNFHIETKIAIK